MTDSKPQSKTSSRASSGAQPTSLGVFDKAKPDAITIIEIIAIGLTVLWLLGALLFYVMTPATEAPAEQSSLRGLMIFMAVFMPIGMIWIAAIAARTNRAMREETQRLQGSIDAMRHAYVAQQQSAHMKTEGKAAPKPAQPANPALQQPVEEAPTATPEAEQPALEFETPELNLGPAISKSDLIRALNFPETAEDQEGFSSLRLAMNDRAASQVVQAAQDILTLLSQDGIYMDDLPPDRARPEIWREFAQGARGRSVAALGGIRDRSSLALTAGRMKQDPIFRDTAHHFLRRFDWLFADFEQTATDAEITAFADTRTARAFMLLARVAGTFD